MCRNVDSECRQRSARNAVVTDLIRARPEHLTRKLNKASMNWLKRLDDRKRYVIGGVSLAAGTFVVIVGLIIAVYYGNDDFVSADSLGSVPRWIPVLVGQIIAVTGSQMLILGAFFTWVTGKPMTWARAGFATFLTWYQLILYYGIIPNEWLTLTQGPLGWTSQKIFFTIPKALVLNNEVEISYAVVKDAVSGGYHMVVLGLGIVIAYYIQGFGKGEPTAPAEVSSPYGRPLSKAKK